jgi:hypothetical protein
MGEINSPLETGFMILFQVVPAFFGERYLWMMLFRALNADIAGIR